MSPRTTSENYVHHTQRKELGTADKGLFHANQIGCIVAFLRPRSYAMLTTPNCRPSLLYQL